MLLSFHVSQCNGSLHLPTVAHQIASWTAENLLPRKIHSYLSSNLILRPLNRPNMNSTRNSQSFPLLPLHCGLRPWVSMEVGTVLYITVHLRTHSKKHSNLSSDPSTKIFLLRLHSLRLDTPNKHLHNSPPHAIRPRLRAIPPPHKALLPVISLRAPAHNPPNCHAHSFRPCPQNPSAQCEFSPLWCIHPLCLFPSREAPKSMACGFLVQYFGICSCATGYWTCVYKSALTVDL